MLAIFDGPVNEHVQGNALELNEVSAWVTDWTSRQQRLTNEAIVALGVLNAHLILHDPPDPHGWGKPKSNSARVGQHRHS